MKTPLSPAEVHRQYQETITTFLKTVPDATLRLRLGREAAPSSAPAPWASGRPTAGR